MKQIGSIIATATVAFLFLAPQVALAVDSTFFDATNSIIDPTDPVGTQWHELYPNFCSSPYTILGWADNGNGVLDSCDVIAMENPDGTTSCHHVVLVTYTLELTRLNPPDQEPHFWDWDVKEEGDPLTDPVCTWWTEVYPEHGDKFHIQAWEDNESGVLDLCDGIVDDAGAQYHVEGVHTDMVTEPADECAIDISTWGRIKSLFR